MRSLLPRLTVCGVLIAPLTAGCSTAPRVAAGPGATSTRCAGMASLWPTKLGKLSAVDTAPPVPWAQAWGDPPVIARCGMEALRPTRLECVSVNNVDWVIERLSDGVRLTTYGTDPALEVLVPSAHGPGPLLLPAFEAAARTLPQNGRKCS